MALTVPAAFNCTLCLERRNGIAHRIDNKSVCRPCIAENILPKYRAALESEYRHPIGWSGEAEQAPEALFSQYLKDAFHERWGNDPPCGNCGGSGHSARHCREDSNNEYRREKKASEKMTASNDDIEDITYDNGYQGTFGDDLARLSRGPLGRAARQAFDYVRERADRGKTVSGRDAGRGRMYSRSASQERAYHDRAPKQSGPPSGGYFGQSSTDGYDVEFRGRARDRAHERTVDGERPRDQCRAGVHDAIRTAESILKETLQSKRARERERRTAFNSCETRFDGGGRMFEGERFRNAVTRGKDRKTRTKCAQWETDSEDWECCDEDDYFECCDDKGTRECGGPFSVLGARVDDWVLRHR